MKRITLILSLFIFCCSWHGNAQVLSESFDSPTFPAGWTNEYVNKTEDWNLVTGNAFGATPHSDPYMMEFKHSNFGAITKLVTPSLDISTVNNPQLTFFLLNLKIGVVDELRVYYKTSTDGEWTQIGENYNYENSTWREITLNLPEASSDYYIAFEGKFNFGGGVDLDDVTVDEGPSCLAPTNLKATNLTATSAYLEWTEEGSATSWNIEYGPVGFTPGSGTTMADNDGTLGVLVNGLSANTTYDFYVNGDCGSGDISAWAGPKQFTTTCTPISSFPWTEDFEEVNSPDVPSCWTVVDYNDDARTFASDEGFGVDNSFAVGMYTDFNNGNNDDYLMLPPLNLDGNQKLTFYTLLLNDAQPDEFEVLLSTTENDVEDFTTVILPTTTVNTAGPNEVTIDLSDYTGIVHIAIHIPDSDTDGYYIYFDDFSVKDIVLSCPPVTDLSATPLGNGTVDVSWTPGASETEWEIEYGAPGFTLGTGTILNVTDTPETNLTGLEGNRSFELYVTAVCGAGDESTPTGPVNFRTVETDACGQTQYGNNFEGVYVINPSSGYKIADDFIVSASTTNLSIETITANIVAGGGVTVANITFYEDDGGIPGAQIGNPIENIVPTSQDLIGMYQDVQAWEVVIDLPTAVDFTNGPNNTPATYWIQIAAIANEGSTVGIEMTSANHIGNYAMIKYENEPWMINPGGFDAVFSVEGTCSTVECPEPTNLSTLDITGTSATITWNAGGSETEWELEYGPAGFELGTGTVIMDNDGIPGETITGLDPATYYEYYVTPLCSSGDPFPAGPKGFSTLCVSSIDSFPFVESFENNSGTRDCWTNEYVSGIETDWKYMTSNGNNSITPRTGELMAQFKIESIGEKTKLVSPALDLTVLSAPQLTFYFANTEWIGDVDELRIYYKTSAAGSWTQIGESFTTEHTVWTEVILDLPNPSSEYYIAFEGKSNFARGMDLDDVKVAEAPACMQPLNLNAQHMTQDSVELLWDEVSDAANGYEWFIFEADADPTTSTPVATGTTTQGTTSVNVTGLEPFTIYDFYVKADCDAEGMSNLAGPSTFKTAEISPSCGEFFYDTGGIDGDYENQANVTTIISPDNPGDAVTVTFMMFDVDFNWDVLYVHDGPDATYPLIASGNGPTPNFPAGGYYGQTPPDPFTSTHSSGALTFVFRSDFQVTRSGWVADIVCAPLGVTDNAFENFTFYPNPAENSITLKSANIIENVKIYNLLGQEVMTVSPNATTPIIETSSLQTGTYLMKVSIDGNEKTYRLLRK